MKASEAPQRPIAGPIENVLQELYARLKCLSDGSLATYIPELANAQSESFGLSVGTPALIFSARGEHCLKGIPGRWTYSL